MIRTRRLLLRPGNTQDLDALHEIFSDTVAMRYWDRPAYTKLSETKAFLDRFIHGDPEKRYEFILDLDGQCIGKAGIWDAPEVGYIIHPRQWRKGFAFEALDVILPNAFNKFRDINSLTAEVDPRNNASIALLKKLGFQHRETIEKNFLYGESELCDTAYYTLARPS